MATGSADDPYRVLGVDRAADDRTIDVAYRTLARRFHPDIAGERSTTQMIRINVAYDAIRTDVGRAALAMLDPDDAGAAGRATAHGGQTSTHEAGSHPAGARGPHRAHGRTGRRWRTEHDGTGGAGPAPGRPSGTVLHFGRHLGWSIGEIARVDPGYLDWLSQRREGEPYLEEIDATLQRVRYRQAAPSPEERPQRRRRVFRAS